MTAIALTIAGSDSGGGVDIQADVKAFAVLGAYGISAMTMVHALPPTLIQGQIEATFNGLAVTVVKFGMFGGSDTIRIVAKALRGWEGVRLLVVGTGGLSLLVVQYLPWVGGRRINLIDPGFIEESNLHRQPIHGPHVGLAKARVTADILRALSPEIRVVLSDTCMAAGKPLISASARGLSGYIGGFCGGAPSLRAVFPDLPETLATCATAGVLEPVVGMFGLIGAQMALAVILRLTPSPLGRLIRHEMVGFRSQSFRFDGAPEPDDPCHRFIAKSDLRADDFVVELRDETEAPHPVSAAARRLKVEDFGPGGPRTRPARGPRLPIGPAGMARRRPAARLLAGRDHASGRFAPRFHRRNSMTIRCLTAALVTGLLMALPAQAQDEAAPDKLVLILDWFVNPDHAPIILAQELGYFTEAGLAVEIVAPADPTEPPKLVAAGRADLAVSYQPQLHLQVHEGLPLRRVGTLVSTPLNCLMVDAEGPVQELADLKGRRIGYSVAGFEETVAIAMLQDAGLGPDDVEMINVNWSLTPALLTGQVDAVIGAFRNFELTQARLAGREGRCFYPEEAGIPAYDELIFIANPDRLDRARIARFMAAVERGALYMLNHPDEAFTSFAATSPHLADDLNRQAWSDTLPRFSHSPAALDHGRYARFEAFMHEAGLIPDILPVSELALDPEENR